MKVNLTKKSQKCPSQQELDGMLDDALDQLEEIEKVTSESSHQSESGSSTSLPRPASSRPAVSSSTVGARHHTEVETRLRKLYERDNVPTELTEVMNSSESFREESWWRQVRELVLKQGPGPLSQPMSMSGERVTILPSDDRDPRSTLFMAMCAAPDFVLVDEMIMLGADTDKMTINGESPLFFCCYTAMNLPDYEQKFPSYERIIRRLLEVGVDPSAAPFAGDHAGLTPLHLACRMGSMGMVKLLLEYGANPHARSGPNRKGTPPEHLLPRDKLTAYRALLQRTKTRKKKARPPRLCWCLSGEKFSDCHEKGKPVRDEAFCPCESGKRHARCCKKRGVVWHEKRDEYYEVRTLTDPGVTNTLAAWREARKQQIREEHGREMLPTDKVFNYKDKKEFNQAMASMYNGLAEAGLIDHAFARLMGEVGFTPRYTRLLPKTEMLLRMMEWNTAADAYISSGADGRGAEELELELKIGPDHAPLRRRCNNNPACTAVEPDPAAAGGAGGRFLLCSRCKKVCYCSPGCQRSHWKDGKHKKNCGSDEFVPLPSQAGLVGLLASAPEILAGIQPKK